VTLNLGALLIYSGAYIEKGMGLVIPGFTPSTIGEIYEYTPSRLEVQVAMGVFGIGFLVFTLMLKVAIPILQGEFSAAPRPAGAEAPAHEAPAAAVTALEAREGAAPAGQRAAGC
jgi:Ni/Fe-hydrogenase subunit HybB-like protein